MAALSISLRSGLGMNLARVALFLTWEPLATNGAMDSHVQWDEKIFIEPDLGDQRRSTFKALPAPPKTPKRVMMKYRFSGVFPLVLSLATFILTLVVVLAGQDITTFRGQYLVAVRLINPFL